MFLVVINFFYRAIISAPFTILQKILTFNIDEHILYIHLGVSHSKLHNFFLVYLKLMFHPEFDSPISCKGKKQ